MEQTFNNGEKQKMKNEKFTTWENHYKKMKHDKLDIEIQKQIEKSLDKKISKFWRSKFWTNYINHTIEHYTNDGSFLIDINPIDIYKQFCIENPTTFCNVEFFAIRYEQKINEIYKKCLIEQRKQQMNGDFK